MNNKHRATLKQVNKSHKTGKHASKSEIKRKNAGKIGASSFAETEVIKSKLKSSQTQLRNQKRSGAVGSARGMKTTAHTAKLNSAPRQIGLVSLLSDGDQFLNIYRDLLQVPFETGAQMPAVSPAPTTITVPQWKERITFVPIFTNLISFLDVAKVADIMLFIIPPEGFSEEAHAYISLLKSQGVPTVMGILDLSQTSGMSQKQKQELKKLRKKEFQSIFPNDPKLMVLENQNALTGEETKKIEEMSQILRFLCQTKLKDITWRGNRPYLLAQHIDYQPETQLLAVSGYLRGAVMDANNLVHIPDFGDFQLAAILGPDDPHPLQKGSQSTSSSNNNKNEMQIAQNQAVLAQPDPEKQQTLQTENIPDPFANEQTWPTEDEIQEAHENFMERKKKKVPKGTTKYQAAWLVDSDDEELSQDDDENGFKEEEELMDTVDDKLVERVLKEHPKVFDPQRSDSSSDDDERDFEEEEDPEEVPAHSRPLQKQFLAQAERKSLEQQEKEDDDFPDEIDTPVDPPARIRFVKYRGLKSFRSTPWDPKENLPFEYAKIFQFQNFTRTMKRVTKPNAATSVDPGNWVQLIIKGVPSFDVNFFSDRQFVLSGLLAHENKMSVLNFNVDRVASYTSPVRSKDRMIFHFGFRRYPCRPIFSENNLRSDKFKYLRFLHPGKNSVATIFAPITFPPNNVLIFKDNRPFQANQNANLNNNNTSHQPLPLAPQPLKFQDLICVGNMKSVDPDRMVIKKILLSGIPWQTWGKYAKVKDLFFDPVDVKYFKKIELYTKHGRTGHIMGSVGTHGQAKCVFDDTIFQHDTVMLPLYKRVFPVWRDKVMKRELSEEKRPLKN